MNICPVCGASCLGLTCYECVRPNKEAVYSEEIDKHGKNKVRVTDLNEDDRHTHRPVTRSVRRRGRAVEMWGDQWPDRSDEIPSEEADQHKIPCPRYFRRDQPCYNPDWCRGGEDAA